MKVLYNKTKSFLSVLASHRDFSLTVSLSAFCLSLMTLLYVKDTYFGFVSFRPFFERLLWIFLIFIPIIVTLYDKKRSLKELLLILCAPVLASAIVIIPIATRATIFWHEIALGYLGLILCLGVLIRIHYVSLSLFSKDALRIMGGIFILVLIVFVGGDTFSLIMPLGMRSVLVRSSPIYYLEFFQRGLLPASFLIYGGLVFLFTELLIQGRVISKSLQKRVFSKSLLALLAGIAVLLYFYIQDKPSLYVDLSGSRGYSISPMIRKAAEQTQQKRTLYVFISSSLPARYVFTRSIIVSLFSQLNSPSLSVKIVDPYSDPSAKKLTEEYQIPSLDLQDTQTQSYTSTTAFFGAALVEGNKVVTRIPTLLNLENVHYDLYKALETSATKKEKTIQLLGFVDKQGARTNFSGLHRKVEQLFSVIDTPASGTATLDADITLVRVQADSSYEKATPDFKEYVQRGHRLVLLINGVGLQSTEKGLVLKEAKHGLEPLLQDFGIKLNRSILASQYSEVVPFATDYGQQLKPYPYALKTNKTSVVPFNTEVVLPWASPVAVVDKEGISHTALLKSQKATTEVSGSGTVLPPAYSMDAPHRQYLMGVEAQELSTNGSLVILGSEYMAHDSYVAATPGTYDLLVGILAGPDAVSLGIGLRHQLWHVQSPKPFTRSEMSSLLLLLGMVLPVGLLAFAYAAQKVNTRE